MTGFGESSAQLDNAAGSQINYRAICKSVNNRFVDISLKLPPKFSSLEFGFQKTIRSLISRGRIEISVTREVISQKTQLIVNKEILESALKSILEITVDGISKEELVKTVLGPLLSRKEVLDISGSDIELEKETEVVENLIKEALGKLIESREFEGERLKFEIEQIISNIALHVESIDVAAKLAPSIIKERFEERLTQLYASYKADDPRMLQEIAILSDKVDIREEIVRLRSHVEHFRSAILEGGKKLEFIVQEMGRETNTIGSKTSQIEVSTIVIEVKSLLEKLREQLLNIE